VAALLELVAGMVLACSALERAVPDKAEAAGCEDQAGASDVARAEQGRGGVRMTEHQGSKLHGDMEECDVCGAVSDPDGSYPRGCPGPSIEWRARAEAAEEQVRYEQERNRNNVIGWQRERDAWRADAERLAEALRKVVRCAENAGFPPGACGRCANPAKDALAAHEALKAKDGEARDG